MLSQVEAFLGFSAESSVVPDPVDPSHTEKAEYCVPDNWRGNE
jgi:hypothetical protein